MTKTVKQVERHEKHFIVAFSDGSSDKVEYSDEAEYKEALGLLSNYYPPFAILDLVNSTETVSSPDPAAVLNTLVTDGISEDRKTYTLTVFCEAGLTQASLIATMLQIVSRSFGTMTGIKTSQKSKS